MGELIRKELGMSQAVDMDNEDSASSSQLQLTVEQQLALLQALNQQSQSAENVDQTSMADYLQQLQLLAARMQELNSGLVSGSMLNNAFPCNSLSRPAEDVDMTPPQSAPAIQSAREQGSQSLVSRNRRTFSGSGQTISQHTRDRLKTMIASKKQKQRLYSTSSIGSSVNVSTSGGPSFSGLSSASGSATDVNLFGQLAGHVPNTPLISQNTSVSNMLAGAVPFDPHQQHPPQSASSATQMTDFQLRKVNSEPNLKMRIRARLLNKGSSPVASLPHPYHNVVTATSSHHRNLQRCDSDSVSDAAEVVFKHPDGIPLSNSANSGSNLVIPSPSLPNLSNNFEQLQLDLNNLMMQASFASFLSMPSLLKNSMYNSSNSMLDSLLERNNTASTRFDNNARGNNQLHVGGYPSLLKQQLRDLVLRRKSLVREEPEEEQLMDVLAHRMSTVAQQVNKQLKTGLVYDAAMSKHACLCGENQNHVEHGGRVHSVWARLQERGLVEQCERVAARKAPLDLLRLVHTTTYVTFFAVSPTACLKLDASEMPLKRFVQLPCGGIGVDSDTYFNDANTQLAIRFAVGSLVELVTQVVEGKVRNGFACIRPPGHHAESEQAMGFCFFNNVAIATRYLQKTYFNVCKRIAIVDWDVHHGNGTQLCFESDPSVLYISLHRHDNGNFFPGTGAVVDVGKDLGRGFTVNVPFSGDVMGDAEYLAAWRVVVLPLLDSFRPDFVIVSAGFDGVKGHAQALGGYELSPKLFGYLTRSLLSYAEGRVVLALEGGYDLAAICDSAEECVKALCANGGDISELGSNVLEKVPNLAAQETIQKVIAVHKKNWPGLSGIQGINMSEIQWQTVSHGLQSLTVRP